jgi:hypothetical protein
MLGAGSEAYLRDYSGVNMLKAKDRSYKERPGARTRVPSAAAAIKGLRYAPMNAPSAARP